MSIGSKIKVFGKTRGRRLYGNTSTTESTVRNLYLKSYNDT